MHGNGTCDIAVVIHLICWTEELAGSHCCIQSQERVGIVHIYPQRLIYGSYALYTEYVKIVRDNIASVGRNSLFCPRARKGKGDCGNHQTPVTATCTVLFANRKIVTLALAGSSHTIPFSIRVLKCGET
jgi:hypothetical protein